MAYSITADESVPCASPTRRQKTAYRGFSGAISGRRSYNSEMGRWVNRDPIGENGGAHLYGLLSNGAGNNVDFLGLVQCNDNIKWAKERSAMPYNCTAYHKVTSDDTDAIASVTPFIGTVHSILLGNLYVKMCKQDIYILERWDHYGWSEMFCKCVYLYTYYRKKEFKTEDVYSFRIGIPMYTTGPGDVALVTFDKLF